MSVLFPHSREGAFPRYADVVLPLNLPRTLTYGIPADMQERIRIGMRVDVNLGRNKQHSGLVVRLHDETPEAYQVKPIRALIDEEPVVNERQLRFWSWITHYYMAAPGEVMQAALPAHLKLSNETRLQWMPVDPEVLREWSDEAFPAAEALELKKELSLTELRGMVGQRYLNQVINELLEKEVAVINDSLEPVYRPRTEKIVHLRPEHEGEEALHALFDQLSKAPKQLSVLMAYIELKMKNGYVRQVELVERSSATAAQVKALADKGIFSTEEKEIDRLVLPSRERAGEIVFTPAQEESYQALDKGLQEKDVALLQGVTGSGKTLLYIRKIRECLAAGKQAILLLPEIGLTTQLVSRLYAWFGEEMGVYHSRFSNNERVEIWEKVRKGQYRLVVGPRSALWLPYDNLGLVIADEEHDASYKQKDPAPRFHARDAAVFLASLHHAKVVLGSATPSVESLYNAQQGKYAFVLLNERYQGVKLPAIEFINAKSIDSQREQGIRMLSPELIQGIKETLAQGKQVILFQNRRGYAPFQLCTVCGYVPHCRNCAVSMTYHKSTDKLHCHYCGQRSPVLHTCPQCGSNRLLSRSFGTEKIEEEVQQVFPDARVARMDVDSMRAKQSLQELLDKMHKQKVDILVGTQMVVKGLDFAPVALVGILSADSLLSYPDFRVNERAFQLMEQVSGRAGRSDGAGRVLIQAFNLGHPILAWVREHDVQGFYAEEIVQREQFLFPPFVRMIRVIIRHRDEPKAVKAAAQMAEALQALPDISVKGPLPALVARVRNLYVQEVWVKCPRDRQLIERTKALALQQRATVLLQRGNSGLQIAFDVDPVS